MQYAVDLHIHSALSPCSEEEMTPNNIVNMAVLKGLDIIAVTDHNTVENCPAVMNCARNAGLVAIPGMELETREEVHLLCLFPNTEAAFRMQEIVYAALPKLLNREEIFGQQLVMDEKDNIIRVNERLLLTAAGIGAEEAVELVSALGGVVIPAHIDRASYSIISNLGMMPENLKIKYVEFSKECCPDNYRQESPSLTSYQYIISSDAHKLKNILEREFFLELEENSIGAVIKKLRL